MIVKPGPPDAVVGRVTALQHEDALGDEPEARRSVVEALADEVGDRLRVTRRDRRVEAERQVALVAGDRHVAVGRRGRRRVGRNADVLGRRGRGLGVATRTGGRRFRRGRRAVAGRGAVGGRVARGRRGRGTRLLLVVIGQHDEYHDDDHHDDYGGRDRRDQVAPLALAVVLDPARQLTLEVPASLLATLLIGGHAGIRPFHTDGGRFGADHLYHDVDDKTSAVYGNRLGANRAGSIRWSASVHQQFCRRSGASTACVRRRYPVVTDGDQLLDRRSRETVSSVSSSTRESALSTNWTRSWPSTGCTRSQFC